MLISGFSKFLQIRLGCKKWKFKEESQPHSRSKLLFYHILSLSHYYCPSHASPIVPLPVCVPGTGLNSVMENSISGN